MLDLFIVTTLTMLMMLLHWLVTLICCFKYRVNGLFPENDHGFFSYSDYTLKFDLWFS